MWRAAALLVLGWAGAAQAAEVTLGLGYDDLFGRNGTGAAAFGVQVQTEPLASLGPVGFGLGAAFDIDTDVDTWAGAGFTAALPLRGFRVNASLMAGGYAVGDGGDELGSGLEFRTRLGVSRSFRGPWRLGLALEHKSNAGLGDINPGVESLIVTLGRSY
jgi:hypothetical protein